jgi:hypothetical protein
LIGTSAGITEGEGWSFFVQEEKNINIKAETKK